VSWFQLLEKSHPVWTLALVATVTCAALILGYVNANHFDMGEVWTALGTGGAAWAASQIKGNR
jgi:hypothetical protein